MGDLIDRQEAIDAANDMYQGMSIVQAIYQIKWERDTAVEQLKELGYGLGEKIIHCKDCKYSSPNGKYGCKSYHYRLYETHEMKPDDFCSRAERREDGE